MRNDKMKDSDYIGTGINPEIEKVFTKELIGFYQKWKDAELLTGKEEERMKAFFLLVKGEIEGGEDQIWITLKSRDKDGKIEKELKQGIKTLYDMWKKYTGIEFDEYATERPEDVFISAAKDVLEKELK